MSQILRASFILRAGRTVDVSTPPADIPGYVVRCMVRVQSAGSKHAPRVEDALGPLQDSVRVVQLAVGNCMVLLPDGGLLATDLCDVPLRMPIGPAVLLHLWLRSDADMTGYALFVVEPSLGPGPDQGPVEAPPAPSSDRPTSGIA